MSLGTVQILEMTLDRFFPAEFRPCIFLPLITVNCATSVFTFYGGEDYNFTESIVFGSIWSRLGVKIAALAGIGEKTKYSDVLA